MSGHNTTRTFELKPAVREQTPLLVGIVGPSGTGKAQPIDAAVLTPVGWRLIGQLAVGDIITDPDGGIATVRGVYPQGNREVYRVAFSDGSATECCNDHLWLTETILDRGAFSGDGRPGTIKSLGDIRETLRKNDKRNHFIPMVAKIDMGFGDALPIHPYLMGVILGDGGTRSGSVLIHKPNPELIETVRSLIPDSIDVRAVGDDGVSWGLCRRDSAKRNELIVTLENLGLMGKLSTEKFIPESYKWRSFDDRLELLRGLMDTDGHVSGSSMEYSSSSAMLGHDVRELVMSLGGKASIGSRIPTYTYKGERRDGVRSYRLHISLPGDVIPFRNSKGKAAHSPRTKYQPTRCIDSIESAGTKECVCIAVDSKRNLYVTDDFIVTHNTYSALRLATGIQRVCGGKIAVIDTEARRALHYSDQFKFDHLDFKPPFDPLSYLAAIELCVNAGAKTIVIDSLSHEHTGAGGVLEIHQAECERLAASWKCAITKTQLPAWAVPKAMRTKLVNGILQLGCNLIACFRAKEKIKIVSGRDPIPLGWQPIAGEEYIFEMAVNCLLLPGADGVPTWNPETQAEKFMVKNPTQFRSLFKEPRQLSEDIGEQLARWAAGSSAPPAPRVWTPKELDARYVACQTPEEYDAIEADRLAIFASMKPAGQVKLMGVRDAAFKRLATAKPVPTAAASAALAAPTRDPEDDGVAAGDTDDAPDGALFNNSTGLPEGE